jgi:hypothetical protein
LNSEWKYFDAVLLGRCTSAQGFKFSDIDVHYIDPAVNLTGWLKMAKTLQAQSRTNIQKFNLSREYDVNEWRIVVGSIVSATIRLRNPDFAKRVFRCVVTFACIATEIRKDTDIQKREFGRCRMYSTTINGVTHSADSIEFVNTTYNCFSNVLFQVHHEGKFECVHDLIISECLYKSEANKVLLETSTDAAEPIYYPSHFLTTEIADGEAWIDYDMFNIDDDMRLAFYSSDMEPPQMKLVHEKFKSRILVKGQYGYYASVMAMLDAGVPEQGSTDRRDQRPKKVNFKV